jgi:gliding motility-associatede transport system auxiliary component
MKTKTKIKSESTFFLITLAGILIFVNILSVRFFNRGDLTRDGLFTLSNASVSLVKHLDDRLVVKAYFTKNLPGRYATLERHVRDLLEEYSQHAGSKMIVDFIDPAGDEEAEEVAKSLGIQKMPNPDIEKDQATVKEGYRGISFSYGEKTEVIAAVESPVGLEYQITSLLKKLSGRKENVGFLVGHGEPEIDPPQDPQQQQQMPQPPESRGAFRTIRTNLDFYNYKQISLKESKKGALDDLDALIVVGPRESFSDVELFEIDQYVLGGGAVLFFVDGVNVDMRQGQIPGMPPTYHTSVNKPNLRELLNHFGVKLGEDLIMDAQAAQFPAKCPPLPIPLPRPYPAWPQVTTFGEDHPVTFRLGSVSLPYTSSVRITEAAQKNDKIHGHEIAFSSGNSWTVDADNAIVDPCGIEVPKNLESSIPLVAVVKGSFDSFFKGKELPKAQGNDVALNQDAFVEHSTAPGRIVVVGSAGLPLDEMINFFARLDRRQAMSNFTFVQNALEWTTSEENLIAVRMKTVDDPPLEKVTEGTKAGAKYGNIIGIPFIFMLFGLVRWRLRRSKKSSTA